MFKIKYAIIYFLLFVFTKTIPVFAGDKTTQIRLSGHATLVVVRDKINELDNTCNYSSNLKLKEDNFDTTLFLVHEPEESNNTVELLLNNVKVTDSEKEIRLIVRATSNTVADWVEASVTKINNGLDIMKLIHILTKMKIKHMT